MNIKSTLKALPFLSMLAASLILAPGVSVAGDNNSRQHSSSSSVQHNRGMARQAHARSSGRNVIRHQQQARPHYKRATKPHYRARSHYSSYQPQYINNTHADAVTPVYQPVPVVHTQVITPVITPALTLGLHPGNVTLSLNSH
ncbi:hypothetical protein MNBD_GAMMA11-989 [hydrothermal vent metagenome]|uniref:Uncharacterized protein n=1 Tax=hydrothermal vent metagenome TaxID=652676 RepID=A0A3B0XC16_9ZZZZ